jgi:hypothetical protein
MSDTQYHDGLSRVIEEQEAHDSLAKEVTDEADQAYLDQAQQEINNTRAHLGDVATKVVLTPEGTVEDAASIQKAIREGHEMPGAYDGHGRE